MSSRTRNNLNTLANVLEKLVNAFINAVELVLVDFAFKKGKYRKRGAKPRHIVHKTVIYRQGAPRVVYVKEWQK